MRKIVLILFVLVLGHVVVLAETVDTVWTARYNGTDNEIDKVKAVAVDDSGYVYVAGETNTSTVTDPVLIKYKPNGDTAWVRVWNFTEGDNHLNDMAPGPSGRIFTTGARWIALGDAEIGTTCYEANGDTAWVRTFNPGTNYSYGNVITTDADGNVYVGAEGNLSAIIKYRPDGDTAWVRTTTMDYISTITVNDAGDVFVAGAEFIGEPEGQDIVIEKYDSTGTELWDEYYDIYGGSTDNAVAMCLDNYANVYVVGYDEDFSTDYNLIKYDSAGNYKWNYDYDDPYFQIDVPVDIAVDYLGNVFITGFGYFTSASYEDYITLKINSAGDLQWLRAFTSGSGAAAYAMTVDNAGNAYITGALGADMGTIKYEPNGDTAWIAVYDYDSESDCGWHIVVDDSGFVYIAGHSTASGEYQDITTIKYEQISNVPKIINTYPAQNALNVNDNVAIEATFDIDMDELSIDPTSFLVYSAYTGYNSGTVEYSALSRTAVFIPIENFKAGDKITAMLSGDITSSPGEPLENFYWSFTVATEDRPASFLVDSTYSTATNARDIVAADFDGDGYLDLASCHSGSDDVKIFYNNGDGTFSLPASCSVYGQFPLSIAAADFDYDGDIDLAAACWNTGIATVVVNDGPDIFSIDSFYTVDTDPVCIAAGELDNHVPAIDLVTSNAVGLDLSVLLNQDDALYSPMANYAADNMPYSIVIGDLNGDGSNDMAAANSMSDNISLYLNYGDGVFTPQVKYDVGMRPMDITGADFDGDGDIDLATADKYSHKVSILYNDGNGAMTVRDSFAVAEEPSSIAAADVDGNGYIDIIALSDENLNDSLSILLNSSSGFTSCEKYTTGYYHMTAVTAGDFDNDGDIDLATADGNNHSISVIINNINTITVTNLDDSGEGSLRWAIDSAINDPAENYIEFAVSGTIEPLTGLPSIQYGGPLHIDGSSAPGKAGSVIIDGAGVIPYCFFIRSGHHTIKGMTIRNFIQSGIEINDPGSDSIVIIGNNISGCAAGIILHDTVKFTQIGGYSAAEKNTITECWMGISVSYSDSNMIVGNQIGGTFGNPEDTISSVGIDLYYSNGNLVYSNAIGYSNNVGVWINGDIAYGHYNTVTRNRIYGCFGLGIDLKPNGVTVNDPGDIDDGPNFLLNYPEVDSIFMNPDSSFIVYGRAVDSARIEFFLAHPAHDTARPAHSSGHGEAYDYLGATQCGPDSTFIHTIDNSIAQFSEITMTTTDLDGNTSELSTNFPLVPRPLVVRAYSPVNLQVFDPVGDSIGRDANDIDFQSIVDASYTEIPPDSIDEVIINNPLQGTYTVNVIAETGAGPGDTYTATIRLNGSQEMVIISNAMVPETATDSYSYDVDEGYHYRNGDADRNEVINILDITYIIDYLYKGGPAPYPEHAGDADCNLVLNILDITYLISYLYKGGEEPCIIEE